MPFEEQCPTFEESARYFNNGQYYAAHDAFEAMWNEAQGPQRVLYHALVQCSVGMVHLLTTNHRGAMLDAIKASEAADNQRIVTFIQRVRFAGKNRSKFNEAMLGLWPLNTT